MPEPNLFRVLAVAILVSFVAPRGYYSRRQPPVEHETVARMGRSTASTIAGPLSVTARLATLVYVTFPSRLAWASAPFPTWLRWFGVLTCLGGFVLLEWSHRSLGRNWSDQPRLTATQHLITSGPYRWARRPISSAFLMVLGSLLLITANWCVGLVWIASVALESVVRIRYEERVMAERFGESYREYRRHTGSQLPQW